MTTVTLKRSLDNKLAPKQLKKQRKSNISATRPGRLKQKSHSADSGLSATATKGSNSGKLINENDPQLEERGIGEDNHEAEPVKKVRKKAKIKEQTEQNVSMDVSVTASQKRPPARWTSSAMKMLLQLMTDRKLDFAKCKNFRTFFHQISSEMNKNNFDYDCSQCLSKWETLKKSFKKVKDHIDVKDNKQKTVPFQEMIKLLVDIRELSNDEVKSKTVVAKKKTTSRYFKSDDDKSDSKLELGNADKTESACSNEGEETDLNRLSSQEPLESGKIKQEPGHENTTDDKSDGKPYHKNSKFSKFLGAHVSISGGLYKAVHEAVEIGASSFGLFLKSQRTWKSKPLGDEDADKFRTTCEKHGFSPNLILPHGSYLMNCGSPNKETQEKSREALLDELQRCEKLGLTLFNFHPGSTLGEISVEQCMDLVAECINYAHSKTKFCITVIENMSCQGNTIGGRFEELKGIIDRVHDKSRIGVCLDTCHAFAAGYNLHLQKGYQQFVDDFETIIGFKYLKAVHLNDSIGEVGCHLDRHENIGEGKIGSVGFRMLMNDQRFNNIPMILETPSDYGYDNEIKLLYSLCARQKNLKLKKEKETVASK